MSTIAATNLKNASAGSNNIVLNTDGSIGGTCLTQTCRAWVNFNGTGVVAIRASYNVSSITDNGGGDYTINFTNALADANYTLVGTVGQTGSPPTNGVGPAVILLPSTTFLTGSARINTLDRQTTVLDAQYVCVSIFR